MDRGTNPRWLKPLAGLWGVVVFFHFGGGPVLNPFRLTGITREDWYQHVLGWLYYRHESLAQFPIGRIKSWIYPAGTTLGYTDANSLVAILLRPIQSLFPMDFQYIGLWLLFCYVAQAISAVTLLRAMKCAPSVQLLGAALLTLSAPLVARAEHPCLSSHFLLLQLLALHFQQMDSDGDFRHARRSAFLWATLAALIHPYLWLMSLGLAVALTVRQIWIDHRLSARRAAIELTLFVAAHALVLFAFGYIGASAENHAGGFGQFSADANTFFNPLGHSRFLPTLGSRPPQYEGFAYLGLGGLLLAAIAVMGGATSMRAGCKRWTRRALPLLLACVLMGLFALSCVITFNGKVILDLQVINAPFSKITGPFRSSGRFIWPLTYLIGAISIALVGRMRALQGTRVAALLAAVVAVQLSDLTLDPISPPGESLFRTLPNPIWNSLPPSYAHLALLPAQVLPACPGFDLKTVAPLALHAIRHRLTFNSGMVARFSSNVPKEVCGAGDQVLDGAIDPATIYVIDPLLRTRMTNAHATCGEMDGFTFCVRPLLPDAFTAAIAVR